MITHNKRPMTNKKIVTNSQLTSMELTLLAIIYFSGNAVQYCSCERFNIIPTADSPCPGEFTGEPCLTLQQYVANPSLSSNITLGLHSGNYRIDSQFSVVNVNSFTIRANATVILICAQELQNALYEWIILTGIQRLYVGGIIFVGCRMSLRGITNATCEKNSLIL